MWENVGDDMDKVTITNLFKLFIIKGQQDRTAGRKGFRKLVSVLCLHVITEGS